LPQYLLYWQLPSEGDKVLQIYRDILWKFHTRLFPVLLYETMLSVYFSVKMCSLKKVRTHWQGSKTLVEAILFIASWSEVEGETQNYWFHSKKKIFFSKIYIYPIRVLDKLIKDQSWSLHSESNLIKFPSVSHISMFLYYCLCKMNRKVQEIISLWICVSPYEEILWHQLLKCQIWKKQKVLQIFVNFPAPCSWMLEMRAESDK